MKFAKNDMVRLKKQFRPPMRGKVPAATVIATTGDMVALIWNKSQARSSYRADQLEYYPLMRKGATLRPVIRALKPVAKSRHERFVQPIIEEIIQRLQAIS